MDAFATRWFALYYLLLGVVFFGGGLGVMIRAQACSQYVLREARDDTPPALIRGILKYFLLFTLPGLALSLYPFAIIEFMVSLWSLCIIYLLGITLVRWPARRLAIAQYPERLEKLVGYIGVTMLGISPVIFFLSYRKIDQLLA